MSRLMMEKIMETTLYHLGLRVSGLGLGGLSK